MQSNNPNFQDKDSYNNNERNRHENQQFMGKRQRPDSSSNTSDVRRDNYRRYDNEEKYDYKSK
jgi:hypothetical protein